MLPSIIRDPYCNRKRRIGSETVFHFFNGWVFIQVKANMDLQHMCSHRLEDHLASQNETTDSDSYPLLSRRPISCDYIKRGTLTCIHELSLYSPIKKMGGEQCKFQLVVIFFHPASALCLVSSLDHVNFNAFSPKLKNVLKLYYNYLILYIFFI